MAASPRAAAGTKGRVATRPPRQPLAAPPCDARGGGAPHPAGSCGRVPLPCATACASPAGPLEVSSSWVRDTRAQIRPGTREAERGELRPAPSTLPGAGALRGTGPGAEGRGRRPRCHRVALSWGPSAFGSSAANCWRRYRPNDARGPPPSPTSGYPSSGRLRAALSRHVHRGSRGDAHGPVRLSLWQPRTPERAPSPRVAPFSFRCIDA